MAKNKTKMVATNKSLRQRMYEYRWIIIRIWDF